MTRILSFEGNIGSGKSSLVTAFKKYYAVKCNCRGLKICFLQEPIDIWNTIKDKNGKTMIECYYNDQEKYAFSFQMMAYISRLITFKRKLDKNFDIIFTERCLLTDRNVFAKMLYDDGKINEIEYQIYNKWFDEFIKDFPKIEYIYLKTDPATAFDRIVKRARCGENIPLEYLIKCHKYHEDWLDQYDNKYVLDCDVDTTGSNGKNIIQQWIDEVNIFNDINKYNLKFDGASRGNPGPCGAGYIIYSNTNEIIYKGNRMVAEDNTNNFAEYSALILGIKKCIELNIKAVNILGDSQLVIKQINKEYKVVSLNLVPLYNAVVALLNKFDSYTLKHIPREENKEADKLANEAIDIVNMACLWPK
jgi:ribonuclease HI/deoxyadenosine/deoxycytidine kinase